MRQVLSQSYGVSPVTWDHTVLPATQHKWTRPALTPPSKLVLDLPTLEWIEDWVDLGYPADLPSLPHLAGDSHILEPSPLTRRVIKISRISSTKFGQLNLLPPDVIF